MNNKKKRKTMLGEDRLKEQEQLFEETRAKLEQGGKPKA
jgi:hypothetical protein